MIARSARLPAAAGKHEVQARSLRAVQFRSMRGCWTQQFGGPLNSCSLAGSGWIVEYLDGMPGVALDKERIIALIGPPVSYTPRRGA